MAAVLTPVKQQRSSTTTTTARKATTPTGVTPEKQKQEQGHAITHTHKHSRSAASLGSALSISSRKRSRGSGTAGETTPDGALAAGRPLDVENGGKPLAALLDENSDLLRNGRALFAATTTSLGAPLDIPNKRRRTEAAAAATTTAGTGNNTAGTAADILATPQRATTSKSAAPVASKRLSSSKKRSKRGIAEVTGAETGSRGSAAANKLAFLTEKGTATASASKRRAREEEANTVYVAKYRADFPSYVFYFDGLDQSKRREGERAVRELGARTDPFFSKSVTHVVTSRAVPPMPIAASASATTLKSGATGASKSGSSIFLAPSATKENAPVSAGLDKTAGKRGSSISPTKQSHGLSSKQHDSLIGLARRPKTRTAVAAANNAVLPMRTPPKIKPYVDTATDSQDILVKAHMFGMKVWTVEKLQRMLARLLSPQSPSKAFLYTTQQQQQQAALNGGAYAPFTFQPPTRQSLPSLLRAEQLTGSTYERDMTTLRPDHHYFSPKTGYLLVEDTSGEYQPAHIREYEQRVVPLSSEGEDRDTEWPTLWGGQEGRGAFTKPSANYVPTLPIIFAEEPKLTARTNNFFAAVSTGNPSLKRSASMNALRNRHAANGSASASLQPSLNLDSYQAASGNSQAITSNIGTGTSTTTTRSGQTIGGALGAGSNPNSLANGIIVDKRLARLGSKARTHLVTLGRASNASATATATATADMTAVAGAGADKENLPLKGSAALTRGQPANGLMKRSLSLDTGLNTFRHLQPPKDEPKKPGYCENCRVRYEDFKTHTRSKKHRRFALDPANWEELDSLLASIGRPVNPELVELYEAAGCDIPSDVEKSGTEDEDEDDFSSNNGDESEMDEDEEDDSGYASRSDNEEVQAAVAELRAKKARRDIPLEAVKPDAAMDEEDLGDEDTNDEGEGEEDDGEEKQTDSGDASTSEEEDILMSDSGSEGAGSASETGMEEDGDDVPLAIAASPRTRRHLKDSKDPK